MSCITVDKGIPHKLFFNFVILNSELHVYYMEEQQIRVCPDIQLYIIYIYRTFLVHKRCLITTNNNNNDNDNNNNSNDKTIIIINYIHLDIYLYSYIYIILEHTNCRVFCALLCDHSLCIRARTNCCGRHRDIDGNGNIRVRILAKCVMLCECPLLVVLRLGVCCACKQKAKR